MFDKLSNVSPQNPLGVIGLFLALIYGFAAVFAAASGGALDSAQMWAILLFLIGFPLVLLGVFTWLVAKHHWKLYAPSDYRADESFLRLLTPDEQRERRQAEVAELFEAPRSRSSESRLKGAPTGDAGSVREDSRAIDPLGLSAMAIEDLVLREVERGLRKSLRREVALKADGKELRVDAAVHEGERLTIVEVKFVRKLSHAVQSARRFFSQLETVGRSLLRSVNLTGISATLAVVYDPRVCELDTLRDSLSEIPNAVDGIAVELRFFRVDELLRRYVPESERNITGVSVE